MDKTRKAPVRWDDQEIDRVVNEAVRLRMADPVPPLSELLNRAQSVLDENRRRTIPSVKNVPHIVERVQTRVALLAQPKVHRPEPPPPPPPPTAEEVVSKADVHLLAVELVQRFLWGLEGVFERLAKIEEAVKQGR
jgi:hypothetical protein